MYRGTGVQFSCQVIYKHDGSRFVTCGAIDSSYLHSVRSPGRVPAASRALANGGARFLYREPQVVKFHP